MQGRRKRRRSAEGADFPRFRTEEPRETGEKSAFTSIFVLIMIKISM